MRQGRIQGKRPRQLSKSVSGDGVPTELFSMRMFSKKAPKQHQLSPQQVGTSLVAALGGNDEGNGVGRMGVVGRKTSGDGRKKLSHQVVSRWRCFRAIAGEGESQHVDEASLVSMAPRLEGKGPGHSDGTSKPGIEGSPT